MNIKIEKTGWDRPVYRDVWLCTLYHLDAFAVFHHQPVTIAGPIWRSLRSKQRSAMKRVLLKQARQELRQYVFTWRLSGKGPEDV